MIKLKYHLFRLQQKFLNKLVYNFIMNLLNSGYFKDLTKVKH